MPALAAARFPYYFAATLARETSHTHNPTPLCVAVETNSHPSFLSYNHLCWECLSQDNLYDHACCLNWFIKVGKKLGIVQTSDSSSNIAVIKVPSPVEAVVTKSTTSNKTMDTEKSRVISLVHLH